MGKKLAAATAGVVSLALLGGGTTEREKGHDFRADITDAAREVFDNGGQPAAADLSGYSIAQGSYTIAAKAQTDVLDAHWFLNRGPSPKEQAAAACLGVLSVNEIPWPESAMTEYTAAINAEEVSNNMPVAGAHYVAAANACLRQVVIPSDGEVTLKTLDGYPFAPQELFNLW